ncbi:MAG: CoA-binding protein [Gammaproteobacteria bacterium]|nr:CoA-binding protein [Gammaproteobacteria bacterium]NIM72180.1 CoA-binding protein [Gammaproteobacteria bacterium]NIN39095.1 CoA-binding protein [Gammaproteobacteria bacterium]NIO23928.1 CoA-binding protein [Gammaproteobacteria bacterium]NIO64580.1 CoA-binding protein [Gammaproteobacteria bacterium]
MVGHTRIAGLKRLLHPRHLAVFGGRFAAAVIHQSERSGFAGDIWPVNPRRAELGGRPCFPDVESLPQAPDASFVAVPREPSISIVRALAARGAGGAICYASGFAEVGEDGAALQAALVEAAGDLALVGPNCYGILNYLDGVTLWPDVHGGTATEAGVAIITQSGNVGISLTMQQRSLPLGYMISVGNQAALSVADYIEALIEDPRVKAIGIHIESVNDVERFSQAAIAAHDSRVPLVALKVGHSNLGARAALSHTSSLVGVDTLYDAMFERLHIARVQSLPEFLETLKLLAVMGPLPGRRIASISCSGGEAALVADAAETLGMEMPPFDAWQEQRLRATLGPLVQVANPLDYHTYIWGDADAQRQCYATVVAGSQDLTLKVIDYPHASLDESQDWDRSIDALVDAAQEVGARTAVISTLPENLPLPVREKLISHAMVPLQGIQEGMRAVKAAMDIGEWFGRPAPLPIKVFDAAAGDVETIDEWRAKIELKRFGVRVPEGQLADADAVLTVADTIGYPVVLKAANPGLAHKSEVGGVVLNLADADALRRAAEDMHPRCERFLVESMIPAAVAELLVGVTRDAQFGLSLTIGAGGTLVELAGRTRTLLFPVSEEAVRRALDGLEAARLLDGYRGCAAGDRSAVIGAIMAVAAYAEAHAAYLEELDVNPLLVLPDGQGAVAVDALIRMRTEMQE